jgi:hypothetical protein
MRSILGFVVGFFFCLALMLSIITTHDAVPTRDALSGDLNGVAEVSCSPVWRGGGYSSTYLPEDEPTRSACRYTWPRAGLAAVALCVATGCVVGELSTQRRRKGYRRPSALTRV